MTQADISKVTAWLQSQGFTVDKVAESRNTIWFSGTAATAEAAFHTRSINTWWTARCISRTPQRSHCRAPWRTASFAWAA